ncbi:MAG: hypothetical protein G3M78_14345 [Candidatus Nitrohelix vancouverensis]|uniref:Ribosomal RNA methyltransferase FtsJ domain-containing protein n=1 Tax=Candidatus Nitrohelix vancouverensis TaxID=2705534 RepID=A0A7T0G4M5_9BACT|nr:MAG: hypothetical protein G3M78_14345 [Candidatus Nitrohelix vancouverensis]
MERNLENVQSAYISAPDYVDRLAGELAGVVAVYDRLILTDRPVQEVFWAHNVWKRPLLLPIQSISDGAKQLKAIQRNWSLYSVAVHRRAALIQEQLAQISSDPIAFPQALPRAAFGSWTLLDANTLLASPECSSPFVNGDAQFVEDRVGPPSRAYLKLWEACTLMGERPQEGDFCLDVGGAPGGWCWAIQKLGARVLSVDRAPLRKDILQMPGVEFKKGDAFAQRPSQFDSVDWICSDVICYPEKLYDWALEWVESGKCARMICTVKFQGEYDPLIARRFADIPGSRLLHLSHNKHELTWMWKRAESTGRA